MAKDLATQGYLHFEADMFFEVDGHYRYDASRLAERRLELLARVLHQGPRHACGMNLFPAVSAM
jgi:hypothetical protein